MNRREFIKTALISSVYLGTGINITNLEFNRANAFPVNDKRVLVNLLLPGGPDFRYLFVPEFSPDPRTYGFNYWEAKSNAHDIENNIPAWENRWNEHLKIEDNNTVFGINPNADWLYEQYLKGNVAIINNVKFSESRNHLLSQMVVQTGDYDTDPNNLDRDGWGGRLAKAVNGNVVSLTQNVQMFCNGPTSDGSEGFDNSIVVQAGNMRQMSLFVPPELENNPSANTYRASIARALQNYYKAKREEIKKDSIYYRFIQHEESIRKFGKIIDDRLKNIPVPEEFQFLLSKESPLYKKSIAFQIRNLYDSFACSDLVNMRVASMSFSHWDSHRNQKVMLDANFKDLFGKGMALDTLFKVLKRDMPDAYENMVIVIEGEFGRQLRANGDKGTDHGRGSSIIVIGEKVNGGIYGEMFPEEEIPKYKKENQDIKGLTSLDKVFGELCDWVESGAGDIVFPNRPYSEKEQGLDLTKLVST
jgi:uncharacterized protein (DUF1501 family)